MKKKGYSLIGLVCLLAFFNSCDDYFEFDRPALQTEDEAWETAADAVEAATACYVPMMWEYKGPFAPEWFIGDVCSDDALKGGESLSDTHLLYDMENFRTQSDNSILLTFYQIQYFGVVRCNLLLENVPLMDSIVFKGEPALQNRVIGEARFLRALYYFRLVRVYGGVPWVDQVLKYQTDWKQVRATEEFIYEKIYEDLDFAIQYLPEKNGYAPEDLGRATKGAARALLMRAYMNNHKYAEAKLQGEEIIKSGQYSLESDYAYVFTLEGENGKESIFETQYMDESTTDAWNGLGLARGTITVRYTRPRWGTGDGAGWGYNRPTQELYDEFETGDPRREAAIYVPTETQVKPDDGYPNVYLGNRYTPRKYIMMRPDTTFIKLSHDTRGPINRKEIRYPDVLLMYAEACVETGDFANAVTVLNQVRQRARGGNPAILPNFPYGSYSNNAADLRKAIRHERRVELAMEGHRWFDLKRWGILAETMNGYRSTTDPQIAAHMSEFVKGKHELFPIPLRERDLNSPMPQNPGYDGEPIP